MGFVLQKGKKMRIKKGDKCNFLTAIEFVEIRKNSEQFWLFRCDCGKEKVISVSRVKRGTTKSCGCLFKKGNNLKHGMCKKRTYTSWRGMKNRCLNPKNISYKNYGGRGITICPRWLKFENFFIDMDERPKNKSLDRIDNSGNYCKSNCKWSTRTEQNNNKRKK